MGVRIDIDEGGTKHTSHVKNLITLIPLSNSCNSFARLSVHTIAFLRTLNSLFMTQV